MKAKGCRFETLKKLRTLSRAGDFFCSADLKDGYFAIAINPGEHQDFFTFDLGDLGTAGNAGPRFITCMTLSFGWSLSPWVFTKVMRVLVGALRSRGVRVLPYLDDFLLLSRDHASALRDREILSTLLHNLGLRRNETKGMWEPAQVVDHLGLRIDSQRELFLIPPEKVDKIKKAATAMLCTAARKTRWVTSRELASFAGTVLSVHLACPLARYRTRALFDTLSERKGWSGSVRLNATALSDLRWWAAFGGKDAERALWIPPTTQQMHTDAADRD